MRWNSKEGKIPMEVTCTRILPLSLLLYSLYIRKIDPRRLPGKGSRTLRQGNVCILQMPHTAGCRTHPTGLAPSALEELRLHPSNVFLHFILTEPQNTDRKETLHAGGGGELRLATARMRAESVIGMSF